MNTNEAGKEDRVGFWDEVATGLAAATPMIKLFRDLSCCRGAPAPRGACAGKLADALESGRDLSTALEQQGDVFSPCEILMVRAGEASGSLDEAVKRTVEGIREGAFPVPGENPAPQGDAARFWKALRLLLAAGVPVLQALDACAGLVHSPGLADAARALKAGVQDGRDMASIMREYANLFPASVCDAVEAGERDSELPAAIARIVSAIEHGRFDELAAQTRLEAGERGIHTRVLKTVNLLLYEAYQRRASDIHFDPGDGEDGRARFRIDGVLRDAGQDLTGIYKSVVNRIKLMAGMNVAEKRMPQDGRILVTIKGRKLDLRVSVASAQFGERLVIRILDSARLCLKLDDMLAAGEDLEAVRSLCSRPNGLVICNGPVGCGKTTLLYGMLMETDRESRCVMTVEDPVAFTLDGVAQFQVSPAIGLTFASLLRAVMRQNPDVVMVGEIRDLETARLCVQETMTGRLIMSQLHSQTSPDAVMRLIEMGLEPFLVNAALAGVISQRLLRQLCPACREPVDIAIYGLPESVTGCYAGTTFYRPKGCDACNGTGYRGRQAIHEILVMNEALRRTVVGEISVDTVREAARESGMRTLFESGMERAAEGLTSIEEVLRVLPAGAAAG